MNTNHDNHDRDETSPQRPHADAELDRQIDALRNAPVESGPSTQLIERTLAMLGDSGASGMRINRIDGRDDGDVAGSKLFKRRLSMTYARRIYAAISLAAAACLIYSMFVLFNPGGATLAYGQVVQRVIAAKAIAYTTTTKVAEGATMVTMRTIYADGDRMRIEVPGGFVSVRNGKEMVSLNPTNHTATRFDLSGLPTHDASTGRDPTDLVAGFRSLSDAPAEPMGDRTIGGVDTTGFRVPWNNQGTITVWADKKGATPVRIELSMRMGDKPVTAVMDQFDFNPRIDDATFSLAVPAGYTVATQPMDLSNATSGKVAESVADLLKTYAEATGGAFPASLTDWTSIGNAVTKGGGKIDPTQIGMVSGQLFSLRDGYGYAGKDARLGDREKIVFWCRLSKEKPYRAVYGDLRVEDLPADKVPATQPAK